MRTIFAVVTLALALVACDSKFKDCNTVIEGINGTVTRIKQAQVNATDQKELVLQFKQFAKVVGEESERISALSVENQQLIGMRDEYVQMTKDTVEVAGELIESMDAMISATGKAEQLQKDLDKTMAELEKACSGTACIKVMKRIAKTDASGNDEKLAAELASLAADLKAMKTGNDKVDAAVVAHGTKTGELADALKSMKDAEKKGDAAQKKLDAVTEREDPLISKINTFCGAT